MGSNINSAKEDEIGKLHKLITQCHNLKASSMLELAEELVEEGASVEDICLALDSKQLTSAQKWVEYNKVSCNLAEEDTESELSQRLRKIKEAQEGKIVSFIDPEAVGL